MRLRTLLAMSTLVATGTAGALDAHFQPLEFLLGHCWRAAIAEDRADLQCFKPVYGGTLVQNHHEVLGTDPRYGGTTFYSFDPKSGQVRFHYFNSSGAVTEGHLVPMEDGFAIPETHTSPDGKVSGLESRFRRDGALAFVVETRRLKNEQWEDVATLRYVRVEPTEAALW